MATISRPVMERLMERRTVDDVTGCWLYAGAVDPTTGYARLRGNDGRMTLAHRASYAEAFGEIPDGMLVCHRCDVRHCFRPDHLFLGTHADNNADMRRKGRDRQAAGEQHPAAVLNPSQVRSARGMRKRGSTYQEIADRFGITRGHAHHIVNGRLWRSVKE